MSGVFVVPEDDAGRPVSVDTRPMSFRLADTNPVTGTPYYRSRWTELPDFVADVVERQAYLCGGEWNVLVADGEVGEFFDLHQSYAVPQPLRPRRTGGGGR